MKNIIFITHHLSGVGGVQKFIEIISKKFLADGHRVTVIGVATPKGVTYEKPTFAHENYQEICLHKEDVFTTYPHKLFLDAYLTHKSAKIIQEIINKTINPLVIVANPLSYIILKNVDLSSCQKVIGQMHNSTEFLFESKGIFKAYAYYFKKYYKHMDKVLFLTKIDAENAEQILKWKMIDYVANPLPFKVQEEERSLLNDKKVVILGRLSPIKQLDQAITIFSQIAEVLPEWTLDLYGEGELEESLQKKVHDLSLDDRIFFKGFSNNVEDIYNKASITMLTSLKEGLPMSLMESMAYGVPVIAYNCSPGVEELVSGKGRLIQLNDEVSFIKELKRLMEEKSLRQELGDKSYTYIQKFDEDVIAERWYSFFDERTK